MARFKETLKWVSIDPTKLSPELAKLWADYQTKSAPALKAHKAFCDAAAKALTVPAGKSAKFALRPNQNRISVAFATASGGGSTIALDAVSDALAA